MTPPPSTSPTAGPADTTVITLTSISPAVARPGIPVSVTGTLTARRRPLTNPTVRAVLGTSPVVSRKDVATWLADSKVLNGPELASSLTTAALATGTSTTFTLQIPPGRATLSRPWGVLPIAIEVADLDPANHEVLRTFVGWQRSKEYQPISLGIVAPVTLAPSVAVFEATTPARTDAWRHEVGPGSRIARILDGTEATGPLGPVPVSWAVDPAVLGRDQLTPAQAAADPVTQVVAPLAARLAAGATRHPVWALPYADADLAASLAASPADPTVASLVQRSTTLQTALGVPVRAGVAWPADGGLQPPREQGLRTAYGALGPSVVVVSSSALPQTDGLTGAGARRSPTGLPLLAWDDALSRLTLRTRTPGEGVLMAQEFVAETATILGERPGVARAFVVALPRGIDPDPGALRAFLTTVAALPWVRVVPTDDLERAAQAETPASGATAGSWTLAGPPQLDAVRLGQIGAERRTIDRVATILGGFGDSYRSQWHDTLDQLTSTRWRAAPESLAVISGQAAQAGAQATSGIHVSGQTTNFLADEGVLQVTVVNDLAVPVQDLRLVLSPLNPRLRILEQPAPVQIAAASRAVVQVRARAVAAGLVPVSATLTTSDGTPVGQGATITVRANPPGGAFYLVSGGIVALILVLGIVRGLRRRPVKAR